MSDEKPVDPEAAAIAARMKELGLSRDKPYAEPLQPDYHAELNAKLQPKPATVVDYSSLAEAVAVATGIPRRMLDPPKSDDHDEYEYQGC